MAGAVLPPVERPPDLAERVTEDEWRGLRAKLVAAQAASVASRSGPAAALEIIEAADARAYRAAHDTAELRQIQARFGKKEH